MGQVPAGKSIGAKRILTGAKRILIVGDGQLARVLLANIVSHAIARHTVKHIVKQWTRKSGSTFSAAVSEFDPTHIWLAISDSSLRSFAKEHADLFKNRIGVHFAGSLSGFDSLHVAHPLSSFASPISPDKFPLIPFVLDLDGPELSELLPGFDNKSFRLNPNDRTYYHALCAMAGNFTVMLWEAVGIRFQNRLGLSRGTLDVYRNQIFENLTMASRNENTESVLSGPIARGDAETIAKHHTALSQNFEMPLLKIYDGFTDLHRTESK